ncbi:MAG: MATE family efflux transporter [Oscillospiraceae bacterium]|nr:MATE family efflux transporter [Oscillospiraceae bacterium]
MTKDLTVCSPARGLVSFAVPLMAGNMLQQLYNLVDMIVIGKFEGATALAAVGTSSILANFFVAFAFGASMGASIVISQLFGAKQMGRMKTAIKTSILFFFAVGVLFTAVGLLFNGPLLKMISTPDNVMADAKTYLGIYFCGFIFLFMFNVLNAVFNALGDSKKPLAFLAVSAVINIALNLYFVIKLRMGVAGVAWGTVISQGVATILSFVILLVKIRRMDIKEPGSAFDTQLLKTMIKVAWPSTVQQCIVSVGLICLQSVVNSFGDLAMAGYTAASKIDVITVMPMVNAGIAMSTFTAQNIGARRIERIPQGYAAGLKLVIGIGLGTAVILFFIGAPLIKLFVSGSEEAARRAEVIRIGAQYLRVSSIFYFIFGCMSIHTGVLRGSGDMLGFLACYIANFGFRVLAAFTLAKALGIYVMAWSNAIGWSLGLLCAFIMYRRGKWKERIII